MENSDQHYRSDKRLTYFVGVFTQFAKLVKEEEADLSAFPAQIQNLLLECQSRALNSESPRAVFDYIAMGGLLGALCCIPDTEKDELLKKFQHFNVSGSKGGKQAATNRADIRKLVQNKVKDAIRKQYLWNDGAQSTKSITDSFWTEIKTSIDNGNAWQGISNSDLLKGKIGRRTVYNAVADTDPR